MAEVIAPYTTRNIVRGNVVYLVEERPNPSVDYFVLPALAVTGHRVVRCDLRNLPAAADLEGASVIFVRYVSPAWIKLIEAARSRLHELVFFMDDDVLDVGASTGMPWRYRFKLARLAAWRAGWLKRMGAVLWVSTPQLQNKYAAWHPELVLPAPLASPADVCRVFYHGSASHDAEIRWLRPVMEEVLRRDERIVFEIVGGRDVYRMYRGLPRISVVNPMKWPAYQSFLSMPGRHIGLAPLHDLPFNRARSYTKFFDITRCGAAGIYSPDGAYAGVVRHGVEGLLVPLQQDAWAEAILDLARNEPLRQGLLRNAEVESEKLAELARRSYLGLLK